MTGLGHTPLVIAYASQADKIPYALERMPAPRPTTAHRLKTVARQLPAHTGLFAARIGFWAEPHRRWALDRLRRAQPRLVIANDWPALIVAAAYKRETGALLHYDTHEFATLEFDERTWWRIVHKPMVAQLEAGHIGAADAVSTVGPSLAEALQKRYKLAMRPTVVRNIPDRIDLPGIVETAWPLRVLYHGQVLPDRGLEALINSTPFWGAPHRLTIRGDGDAGYIGRLKRRLTQAGTEQQVTFERAVDPDEVMPLAARSADLGVFFTPLNTIQQHFSLPNKLFEYVGAGLAVGVSPGADLKQIVEGRRVGVVSTDATTEAVVASINGLTRERVAAFKSAAREAAKSLCWEEEQKKSERCFETAVGTSLTIAARNTSAEIWPTAWPAWLSSRFLILGRLRRPIATCFAERPPY